MKKLLVLVLLVQFGFGYAQEQFSLAAVEKFQTELNAEYADAKTSPLLPEDFKKFHTLEYYPANEKFFVVAKFIRTENEQPFEMKTSTDRRPVYVKYGEAHFNIDGQDFQLNLYKNIELSKKEQYKDYLFLPFSDLTCGNESYIGGRYIDMKIPKGDTIVIDFNTAYNPYCAYSYKYSCPKVPLENDLKIAIRAGVKKFHD
ncbi:MULTISPECIES: DUF1684 domain-containing protein [Flavobacterium]|uniref:DUF1684 domain-containing protein n=1 Tax=Flavobacterium keumense TaxID=1306518 RepID=A0ABY8N3S1_9FLAO|nr:MULTISPECIES: DUF1684 domain-containing protein [Flavobacterium]WGK94300.1 DUF1684 domain-containing protein [Flavobacterium keumense]